MRGYLRARCVFDGGDVEGGFIADGQLVIAGGDGPVALEPVDPAFDRVAQLVRVRVERRRAASDAAFVLAVADLVDFLRDGAGDLASSQVGAVVRPPCRRSATSWARPRSTR